jgi:large conductance mechanosensitive channel
MRKEAEGMFKSFKEFISKGSMIDMAIGIILGLAIGRVISSLVTDVLMPPIGLLLGNVDFANLYVNLSETLYPSLAAAKAAGAPVIAYGMFVNTIIDFIVVAFVLFLVIRGVNKMWKVEAAPKECAFCFSKIPAQATRCPECTSDLRGTSESRAA